MTLNLISKFLKKQIPWSTRTFGPGMRTKGITKHIRVECFEIEKEPTCLEEWVDVIILALDGAWRMGATAKEIEAMMFKKQAINIEKRQFPFPKNEDTPSFHNKLINLDDDDWPDPPKGEII